MIAGTIIMEDMQLHFITMIETSNPVLHMKVTVCDSMTGVAETYRCAPDDFAVALGMAMHPDGKIPQDSRAEKAMPKNPNLRWIP